MHSVMPSYGLRVINWCDTRSAEVFKNLNVAAVHANSLTAKKSTDFRV